MQFFYILSKTNELKVLLILVVLDTIFGVLRSLREKKINSNIGIDGLIRKCGMLISVIFFIAVDLLTKINLIGFIPELVRNFIGLEEIGISTLFLYLFIIYEFISILKNMIKCKLPIPHKLQAFLENLFLKYTSELEEKGEVKNGKNKNKGN